MTATERLRALLDERGVEWWQSANTLGCVFTRWYSPLFGDEVCAMENGEEGLVLFDHYLTPEQAIEATMGRGTCKYDFVPNIGNGFLNACGLKCSCCGREQMSMDAPKFCPNCGRKVVTNG